MVGKTSCPPATASAPPGMKSFWTSTTSRISRSPGVISVMLLCAREQALHQSAHLVAVPLTRADGHARHCATGTDEERRRQPRDPPSAGRLELGVEQDREGQIEVPHVRLDESARRSPVHGHGKDGEACPHERLIPADAEETRPPASHVSPDSPAAPSRRPRTRSVLSP